MRDMVVLLPCGAGVVRTEHGLVVTDDVGVGGGVSLREDDRFHPEMTGVSETHSVVGGLLPPGAVSAEAVDERGTRVDAVVANGAYAAIVEQPNVGQEPIVCCRDASGNPVRRPWAADYPSVRVTDAEVPCPACGAIDYDEYTPFEQWRGGPAGPDGNTISANPVVSCRVCGQEETEGVFFGAGSEPPESEDKATRAARVAQARARHRKRQWISSATAVRSAKFPIYAADGWSTQISGSGSENDALTNITISQYEHPDADVFSGDQPRLVITTRRVELRHTQPLADAREIFEHWIQHGTDQPRWPDASRAAITLWLRARDRDRRAAVLDVTPTEALITIDGIPIKTLMLTGPGDRWVAIARRADLTINIAAHDIDPASLSLEPIVDPAAQLVGLEPPDA